ncbi:glycosyltransferase family 39 protein [Streptomyces sp. NPDC006879]|uniref:glycosyltransferase family 39 protein n=1 Tax=Streptomyces sp. NPDC006879 TaxID=3364767 RepID=UPI0036C5DBA3
MSVRAVDRVAVAASFAVGLAVGGWGLVRGGIWRDEGVTLQVGTRTLRQISELITSVDAVHGLYYALIHVVFAADPRPGELVLRLPSVIAAAAAAAAVTALGARLARPRVGLWAGLGYTATPFVSRYAQEGRSYALVACAAVLATWLFLNAVERGGRRRWAGYGAAIAITTLLHLFAVLLLAAHAVTLLLGGAGRTRWRGWSLGSTLALVPVLPLALACHGQSGQVGWLQPPDGTAVGELVLAFAGPASAVAAVTLALALVGCLPPYRSPRSALSLACVAGPLLLLPPALLLFASLVEPYYYDRYVLYSLAGLPLLAAAGLDRLLSRLARGSALVTLCGLVLIAGGFWGQFAEHERLRGAGSRADDLTALSRTAQRVIRRGDAVLYLPGYARRIALTHPQRFRQTEDAALAVTGPGSGTLYGTELADPARLRHRLAGHDRVWLVVINPATRKGWHPASAPDRVKLDLLERDFRPDRGFASGTAARFRLYVRSRHPGT